MFVVLMHGAIGSLDEFVAVAAAFALLCGATFAFTRKKSD
jgi:hypothetical protein